MRTRLLIVVPLTLLLTAGAAASYRAARPVYDLSVSIPGPALEAGSRVRVEATGSGRGPVAIRLELVQDGRSETLLRGRMRSRRYAFWDPRPLPFAAEAVVAADSLRAFHPGPATLRAEATGAPAWLWQPTPVVREVAVEIAPAQR